MPPSNKRTEPSTPDADAPVADESSDDLTLAVGWPHDSFTTEDGTTITADGTPVPADREKDIRAEAKDAGVTIRKVN